MSEFAVRNSDAESMSSGKMRTWLSSTPTSRKPWRIATVDAPWKVLRNASTPGPPVHEADVAPGVPADRIPRFRLLAVVGCELGAGTVVCGHVKIGDDVHIGGNTWIRPRITIGAGARIGGGSVVAMGNVNAMSELAQDPRPAHAGGPVSGP